MIRVNDPVYCERVQDQLVGRQQAEKRVKPGQDCRQADRWPLQVMDGSPQALDISVVYFAAIVSYRFF